MMMNNYEKRLLKFLKDNPNVRMTPHQIAGVWKRNKADVRWSAVSLIMKGKLRGDEFHVLTLRNLCEGIGGA